jgi:hypothetical protein
VSVKQHKLIPEALRDEGGAVLVVYTKGHHDPAAFAAEVDAINKQAEAEDDDPEFPSVEPAHVKQYLARVLPVGRGTESYECGFTWTLDYPVEKRGPGVFPVTVYEAWR